MLRTEAMGENGPAPYPRRGDAPRLVRTLQSRRRYRRLGATTLLSGHVTVQRPRYSLDLLFGALGFGAAFAAVLPFALGVGEAGGMAVGVAGTGNCAALATLYAAASSLNLATATGSLGFNDSLAF